MSFQKSASNGNSVFVGLVEDTIEVSVANMYGEISVPLTPEESIQLINTLLELVCEAQSAPKT